MKWKIINIRASEQQKEEAKQVARDNGFHTLSSFFWFMVNQAKKKK